MYFYLFISIYIYSIPLRYAKLVAVEHDERKQIRVIKIIPDWDVFMEAGENPPDPNEALRVLWANIQEASF